MQQYQRMVAVRPISQRNDRHEARSMHLPRDIEDHSIHGLYQAPKRCSAAHRSRRERYMAARLRPDRQRRRWRQLRRFYHHAPSHIITILITAHGRISWPIHRRKGWYWRWSCGGSATLHRLLGIILSPSPERSPPATRGGRSEDGAGALRARRHPQDTSRRTRTPAGQAMVDTVRT